MAVDIVDQYYWLSYARKQVDTAAASLTAAAANISTLVASFWGFYTTAFAIGTTIKKLHETTGVMILLVLPIPLLIFSYMAALWAQMPEMSLDGIDPRVPDQVMKLYTETILSKRKKLWAALLMFFLAGLSLTFALSYANFTHDKTPEIKPLMTVTPSGHNLILSGDVPIKSIVNYKVTSGKSVLFHDSTVVTQNDHFDRTIPAPVKVDYILTLTWRELMDTTISHTYVKAFPLPKKATK